MRAASWETLCPDDEAAIEEFVRSLHHYNDDGELIYSAAGLPVMGWELVEKDTGRVVASFHQLDRESQFKIDDSDVEADVLPNGD
jgi:hypothetical protein